MPVGLTPRKKTVNFFARNWTIRRYIVNARVAHPSRLKLKSTPRHAYWVDTGAHLSQVPYFMIRHFVEEASTVKHEDLRKYWLDDTVDKYGPFEKGRVTLADGAAASLPLVYAKGTVQIALPDGSHRDFDDVLFGFNPSQEIIEEYERGCGRLGPNESLDPREEVFILGQEIIQRMRLFLPVSEREDEALAQFVLTTENQTIRCESL